LVLASGAALYFGMQAFVEPGPSANGDTFMIKPNTGVQEIADQLERRSLISDARIFRLGVRATGNESALKAGEYAIKPRASMRDIMELFKSGKSVMYSLTIPEGLTVEQALQRVADQEALTGDMPATLPPEGSIATDTLRFTRGATRQQMIDKLVADQKKLVEDVWSHRAPDLPIANMDDFVTLASIVEKETGRSDERSRVAAVFLNRLAKGMRLQSDPTIIYGLFGGKGKPADRPIYQSDLDKQTPYNTYLVKG
ncbi:MAG: endolytic transglycosylase MltG, partial [Mesorhizobium sp.]